MIAEFTKIYGNKLTLVQISNVVDKYLNTFLWKGSHHDVVAFLGLVLWDIKI